MSVLRNVTDLARAKEEIEESYRTLRVAQAEVRDERHRLELIIDSVADPILVTDQEGDIVLMNEPAERLFNLPADADETTERRINANGAHLTSFVSNVLTRTGEQRYRGEIQLTDPVSGRALPVEGVAGTILSEQGELMWVVTILHDMTEALEKRRLAAQLEIKVQAATAELGSAQMLKVRDLSQPHMVHEGPHPTVVEFDLQPFGNTAASRASGRTDAFSWPSLARIGTEAVRLSQIVGNLLHNAAKYTGDGGHIVLLTRARGDRAEIVVQDTGIGIAPDAMPRIFELFTQIPSERASTTGGLGIGLALVRALVELHGGEISATSLGVDQGSEFTVRLPLLDARAVAGQATAGAGKVEPAAPIRRNILIADDNQDALESLALMLRMEGHEVHCASDGEEALLLAGQRRPEIVVLDVGMPKLDGCEVARRIRAETWGRDAVLVALTGWGQEIDRRRSREAGFDMHLVKPVDPATLCDMLVTQ